MAVNGKARRSHGFTLIELAVGIAILVMGIVGFSRALVSAQKAEVKNRELDRAAAAARQIVERMQAEAFPDVFRRFNAVTADDPGGAGTAPGASFSVDGLSALQSDVDGFPGGIQFPVNALTPAVLSENVVNTKLGMPRDLSGDGVVDTANHSTDYTVLPVLVVIRWQGVGGPGYYELQTLLADY